MAYTPTNWINGTTPVNATNLNKIEDGIYDNSTAIEDLTPVVLWTNLAPTSNFAAQTISLDLSGYNYIEIYYYTEVEATSWKYKMTTGKLNLSSSDKIILGGYLAISSFDQAPQFFGRLATYSTTGIIFSDGQNYNGSTWSARNVAGVPCQIIGYK